MSGVQAYRKLRDNKRDFYKLLPIHDKATHRTIPFVMNEVQELVEAARAAGHTRIIVLKCRQGGVSTKVRAWAFHDTFFANRERRWATISVTQRSAEELNQMDAKFYEALPPFMKRRLSRQNKEMLEFADTKAFTACFTASSKYGTRSWTFSDCHASEFAFWQNQQESLATIVAAVGYEGTIVIESTPNRRGDHFYNLCMDAINGTNGWHIVQIWWWMLRRNAMPAPADFMRTAAERALEDTYGAPLSDDQLYWRRMEIATVGVYKFRRENPGCLDDAFYNQEGAYYPTETIASIKSIQTGAEWYAPLHDGDIYCAGVDPSEGVGADDAAIVVWSKTFGNIVYTWADNRTTQLQLAEKLVRLNAVRFRGQLRLLVEANRGRSTLEQLRRLQYPESLLIKNDNGDDYSTTASNKALVHEAMRHHLSSGNTGDLDHPAFEMPSELVNQLQALTVPPGKMAPEAPSGGHDDLAIAAALGYHGVGRIREVPMLSRTSADELEDRMRQAERNRRRTERRER